MVVVWLALLLDHGLGLVLCHKEAQKHLFLFREGLLLGEAASASLVDDLASVGEPRPRLQLDRVQTVSAFEKKKKIEFSKRRKKEENKKV